MWGDSRHPNRGFCPRSKEFGSAMAFPREKVQNGALPKDRTNTLTLTPETTSEWPEMLTLVIAGW